MRRASVHAAIITMLLVSRAMPCAADVIEADAREPPGYRVHFVDRDAIAGRTLVAIGAGIAYAHGDQEPETSYTILDEFPVLGPQRVCAVPSEWVIASPVGALGPRMLRGAPTASGAVVVAPEDVQRVRALFEGDEVACAPLVAPELRDRRDIEAVEEAYRATRVEGQTLELALVEVGYQIHGETTTLAAGPDGSRPPPPARPSAACGCRIGGGSPRTSAMAAMAGIAVLLARRLSGARGAARARDPRRRARG